MYLIFFVNKCSGFFREKRRHPEAPKLPPEEKIKLINFRVKKVKNIVQIQENLDHQPPQ
jgi:hypothetical protein